MRVMILYAILAAIVSGAGCNAQSTGPGAGTSETGGGTMNEPGYGEGAAPSDERLPESASPETSSRPTETIDRERGATSSAVGTATGKGGISGPGTSTTSEANP